METFENGKRSRSMKMLKKAMNNERTAGIIFTMPFTIGFLLFMIVPMGISLY